MAKKRTEDRVEGMIMPILDDLKYELVDVEYKKEGSHWYLRIYIDKSGGITLDDCQLVSEQVSDLLDTEDPIPHSYFLEVSSPGLDRVLKKDRDFERYKGSEVDVSLYKPINGVKKFKGVLVDYSDKTISINTQESGYVLNRDDIAVVRLSLDI